MSGEYGGVLYGSVTNTVGRGMSTYEEARYRYDDVDPLNLQPPLTVLHDAVAQKQAERARMLVRDRELGFVAVDPMVLD